MKKSDKVTTTEKPKTTKTVTPSTNSGSITGSVKTGQTSILPIMIAAIVAILAAAGIFVIRKRQK